MSFVQKVINQLDFGSILILLVYSGAPPHGHFVITAKPAAIFIDTFCTRYRSRVNILVISTLSQRLSQVNVVGIHLSRELG